MQSEDKYHVIKERIYEVFTHHKQRYGYRRVMYALRQDGLFINHKTVLKLMRSMNLKSKIRKKKFINFNVENGITAKNLLQRNFYAQAPNEKWVTDFTQFNVNGKRLYLTPIMDLYNGEIISFNTSTRCFFNSVEKILYAAGKRLKPGESPILHSDQGWQYRMPMYHGILKKLGLTVSMSRKGNCWDNAAMESFFAILKTEVFHARKFSSVEELVKEINEYIHYYNHERGKLKLKGLSPVAYRLQNVAT